MTDHDDDRDPERRDDVASAGRPASIEAFHGLAAAYALDALDADERADFERALDGSPELRAEVDAFRASAAHLAEQAEPVAPPPALRDRLMADVAAAPQVGSSDAATADERPADAATADAALPEPSPGATAAGAGSRPAGPAHAAARRRWFQRPGAVIAAAAAAVLLLVGVVVGVGWPGPNGWGAQRERAAIAAAPDARSQTVEVEGGGQVTLVSSAEQAQSVVIAEGLPELGNDQTYELWYIDESGAAPAGTFEAPGGETWRVLEGSFRPGVVVGITVEPAGGSPQPTTEPIVAIET